MDTFNEGHRETRSGSANVSGSRRLLHVRVLQYTTFYVDEMGPWGVRLAKSIGVPIVGKQTGSVWEADDVCW